MAREGGYAKRNPRLARERVIEKRAAIPFGRKAHALTRKCGQRRLRQAVSREGGHAKRNPRLARERVIECRTLPSPHTLARRRFRLARKCPAVPIMRCHRQGQAFSVWRGGQTEWRCFDRQLLQLRIVVVIETRTRLGGSHYSPPYWVLSSAAIGNSPYCIGYNFTTWDFEQYSSFSIRFFLKFSACSKMALKTSSRVAGG